MAPRVKLHILDGSYGIARLQASDAIPAWADGGGFVSITRTDDELSIVCRAERIPLDVRVDAGWSCFKFQGPFAFDETGIVLSVIAPLSTNGIGIFVVSTFDGDHLLVKSNDLEKALDLLANAGHSLV
ncbi:ACT domain-containing protein [Agrobacterium tumefaciens]|uniref:Amino acid-binding protein n=1 Tax=Agrobacterium tumefaciens TaxID=358 RepID=A0A2L2L951_AGRTU|nr:ACT domain-containing protein [Agrobacterium tumefaciens]MCZ7492960.1 ACT domain-containing protein [Rhizobium rhizogenes]AVH40841.1 amino acid-binding protein [Agrobacterium tumefaciens]NSY94787.1 ACT domain-containing protein [Agrobacterium tumefaciens]NSZ02412.1 ACT domain-containing protein [Agrobacterium tumefaciens]NSZ38541.1 ACT domain-containing protein [Agrobacterium tumefaciens]